jgi:hypothetical protein
MSANFNQFLVPKTPHIGSVKLGTTSAQVKSDGTSAGTGTDLMYCVFAPGADGSFVQRIRFQSVANAAATTGVATVLRIYKSTVSGTEGSAVGATTSSNTFLIAEISVPAISSSHSTTATNFFEVSINTAFPSGTYIHVSQHVAQTTNQQWQAQAFGGDY